MITPSAFGITQTQYNTILSIFSSFADIEEVRIFGSRAKGTHKPNSDIDLAIMNTISLQTLVHLTNAFEESDIPYKIDLVAYHESIPEALREHIDRVGKPFWSKIE